MKALPRLGKNSPPPLSERRTGQILVARSQVVVPDGLDSPLGRGVRPECGVTCEYHKLADKVGVKLFRTPNEAHWNALVQHNLWHVKISPRVISQPFALRASGRGETVSLYGFLTEVAGVDRGRTERAGNGGNLTADSRSFNRLMRRVNRQFPHAFLDLHGGNFGWLPSGRVVVIDVDAVPGSERVGGKLPDWIVTA